MERDNEKDPPLDAEVDDERQNAGLDDDQGGDEAGGEGSEAQSDEAEEGLGAKAGRERTYRDQLRAEAERNSSLQRELEQLRAQQNQYRQPQEESDEQFNARLQLMTVEERMDARLSRSERRHNLQMAMTQFQSADRADRAQYEAKSVASPSRKKLAQEVEQVLAQERSRGRDFDRETIYLFLRGRYAEQNEGKVTQARNQGQQRIRQQESRTQGGRSDTQSPARRRSFSADDMSPAAVEWRLSQDGVYI